ncbi:hypothetical protein OIDMADRAFT_20272 [Oidiodendron maius Zn]|uniref:Uncharacterized protein n=1 Tax=Oidiodendron maius (strain Zn) TaxID=913774 RepID=A0A0C3GP77_OIDMZ|nr:hypothetical protein OIDMADRAFT_20272 [Oidiodendron maius Zn]
MTGTYFTFRAKRVLTTYFLNHPPSTSPLEKLPRAFMEYATRWIWRGKLIAKTARCTRIEVSWKVVLEIDARLWHALGTTWENLKLYVMWKRGPGKEMSDESTGM